MKPTILFLLTALIFTQSKAADSTMVSISIQARDIEYSAGFVYQAEALENLKDSIMVRYRATDSPTATTAIRITGYTKDFIEMAKFMRNDVTARANNADSRLIALLSALNDNYISAILQGFVDSDNAAYVYGKKYGKYRLTRK